MTFDLNHWRRPRQAIATRHRGDDMAYATHGALVAVECLKRLAIAPGEAAKMKLLDYGCGTGRMARVLAGYFGRVTAYDPVHECIAEGIRECKIPQKNLEYSDSLVVLPARAYDVVVSVNVIEHLKPSDQWQMLQNIKLLAKPGATVLLWYSMRLNRQAIAEAFGHGQWVIDDEDFSFKNPTSTIQVRAFKTPDLTSTK